jgi:phosphate transport system substrate-binding protein
MKVSAAILITAMICVPLTATVIGTDSHKLSVAGSTTVYPLMAELQKEFEKFANVDMNVSGGGSGVGVSSTLNGVADIGMLSRDLKEDEGGGQLVPHVIAKDAVVVIVNKNVGLPNKEAGIPDLTLEQLAGIYSGKYNDWGEVGGKAGQKIAVIAREEGSGTRDCFEAALKTVSGGFVAKERDVNSVNSTGAVLLSVQNTPGAIGYINLNVEIFAYPGITKVTVDGITATSENVQDKTYEISRDLILVTKGKETGMVKFFMDWILSEDGQRTVESSGFVRVN